MTTKDEALALALEALESAKVWHSIKLHQAFVRPKCDEAITAIKQAQQAQEPSFPLISLGYGRIEVAEGHHEGTHALIFGKNGTGEIGSATVPNREHQTGETLAVVTFANVESLDVVAEKLRVLRQKITGVEKVQEPLPAGLVRCEFDDECDYCDEPEQGSYTRLTHNAEDCTEAEFYICGACLAGAIPPKSAPKQAGPNLTAHEQRCADTATAMFRNRESMQAIKAALTEQAEPEGYKLVPAEPTEAQWNGLARDMMMWLDMGGRHTAGSLFKHLERCGTEIPQWLRDEPEMKNLDHVPSKGTRVAIIYRAMLAAAPTQPEAK